MNKRFVQLLVIVLVFSTISGCGTLPAITTANSHPTLPALLVSFPTSPAEKGTPSPTIEPGSASPCCEVFLPSILTAVPPTNNCPAIQNGLAFLKARYNPALGLLNEAPVAAPHTYWLTNDNALAAYAFARLGQTEMSAALTESIRRYGSNTNGLIEVIWGLPVTFPPYDADKVTIEPIGEDLIKQEFHHHGEILTDWQEYANLGFLGALNHFYRGDLPAAHSVYAAMLDQFDGTGFHDKAFNGRYETYKLALALYVGVKIQAPNPYRRLMLSTMLSMQATENGGFITHYFDLQTPDSKSDTNTETSSLALLALEANGCNP